MMTSNAMIQEIFGDAPTGSESEILRQLEAAFPIRPIRSRKEHVACLEVAGKVMDFLDRHHDDVALCAEVEKYLEILALMVESDERAAFPKVGKKVSGREMLKYLMELQGLSQVDLKKEFGGQANASAVLSGKRELNVRQIGALAKRFKVSPGVFFDT